MVRVNLLAFLASALVANATPTKLAASPNKLEALDSRQIEDPPEGYTYWIEWYPNGCGNELNDQLSGAEETLAACRSTNWGDVEPPTAASVRIITNQDDDRAFHWRLFGSNDCSTQIATGEGAGCFTVPNNQRVGAVIVYT